MIRSDAVRPSAGPQEHAPPGKVVTAVGALMAYGVLALSYSGRHGRRKAPAALGVLGAPVVLGLILLAAPALLGLAGLLPTS